MPLPTSSRYWYQIIHIVTDSQ